MNTEPVARYLDKQDRQYNVDVMWGMMRSYHMLRRRRLMFASMQLWHRRDRLVDVWLGGGERDTAMIKELEKAAVYVQTVALL